MRLVPFFLLFSAAASAVTLDEAYRAALSKSEVVGQSREQVVQAEERVSQLRGGLFPTLALNALHTIQPEPADPVARSFSPAHQTTVNLGLTQPLFRGLREFAGLRQQRHLESAARAGESQSASRLYLDVAQTYLNVLSLEQDLKNLAEQSALYDERVAELGGRVQRGESAASEVLSAQSTQASVAAERRLVQGQLEAAREVFAFLTGLPATTELVDPDVLSAQGALRPLDDYLARVEERPDVKVADERRRAAEESVSVAWGAHLPTVDLVANYYFVRPGFLKDLKWDVGFKATLPLWEGGATQARVREALSRKNEATLEHERLRRVASQEIRSLHQRLRARLEHLEKLKRSVELAEKNSVILRRDYRRGLSRNIDVQIALSEARVSRRSHDQAHFAAQLELLQLRAAAFQLPEGTK